VTRVRWLTHTVRQVSPSGLKQGTNSLTFTELFCVFTLQNGFSSMIFQSTASCMNCRANWIRLWIVVGPKRNRHILGCSGLVHVAWPPTRIFARFLPPTCTFRTLQKHRENMKKFGSCPLRSKTLVFPGVFAYRANCFGFLCLSMHVHACRCCVVSCAALDPGESSSESPESP
jgi:hypothetical protein